MQTEDKKTGGQVQAFNPYLPSFEYVPDGEPHVFGNRIYLYGSHDRFRGAHFCLNDYVCYSADVADLTDWRYEGVIYRKEQDPRNQNIPKDAPELRLDPGIVPQGSEDLNPRGIHAMWAPDVVQGPDGRYYLYYCLDFLPEIGAAVCDTPAGQYEFLGLVRHKDGTPLGTKEGDLLQFDPGIFVDDDGEIYLYSGNAPISQEWIEKDPDTPRKGSQVMKLEQDMLTLKEEPKKLMPDLRDQDKCGFDGHEFFEASSIRKIGGRYYFVYSSVQSHELCYAVSDRPDAGYRFGGTLVDIGDIFLDGRSERDAVNCLGNTHGGIEKAGNQWYVFYHRQTNRTNYSRQACAEKIWFDEDGRIAQTEITSCGLNPGALRGSGTYPARICCHLTGKNGAAFSHPLTMKMDDPYLTQDGGDIEPTRETMERDRQEPYQYIRNMQDGSTAGYKYFALQGLERIAVMLRGKAEGVLEIRSREPGRGAQSEGTVIGRIEIQVDSDAWSRFEGEVKAENGKAALYFTYRGNGAVDFRSFELFSNTKENAAAS
nr:family 43 glycosylhydrolase [uncultured Schaedlerella sp.]